ncbi:YciI family protein [Dactylosporangium cerinum]|uniref:YciI family protein n=1 Tax=Dactylosporangium cerinum TaxID=1434730 RepID=A0ABV9WG20_9ACTN
MPEYMLLLYAPEGEEQQDRWADMPLWRELTESLRKSGLLVANAPLHSAGSATTVRVRSGETQLTDGPFATTKEILAGYYVLNCTDLDEALHHAARMPMALRGSVEVRPIMSTGEIPADSNGPEAGGD